MTLSLCPEAEAVSVAAVDVGVPEAQPAVITIKITMRQKVLTLHNPFRKLRVKNEECRYSDFSDAKSRISLMSHAPPVELSVLALK
jgi:hypothetical protein